MAPLDLFTCLPQTYRRPLKTSLCALGMALAATAFSACDSDDSPDDVISRTDDTDEVLGNTTSDEVTPPDASATIDGSTPTVECDPDAVLPWDAFAGDEDQPRLYGSVACQDGCGYVYGEEFDVGWFYDARVPCPLPSADECATTKNAFYAVPVPCEVDADCEVWNQNTCENIQALPTYAASMQWEPEVATAQAERFEQLTFGGCADPSGTGYDGPFFGAICVDNSCQLEEANWCGAPLAPPAEDGGTDGGANEPIDSGVQEHVDSSVAAVLDASAR